MLMINIHSDMLQCRIYKLLFLLFLAVFTIYPIIDVYAECVTPSPIFFNDLNTTGSDDDIDSIHELNLNDTKKHLYANKNSKYATQQHQAHLQLASIKDGSSCPTDKIQTSTHTVKSHQSYPPASSDSSPPAV